MADRFDTQTDSLSQPARDAFAITPHVSNEIDPLPKAIFVGTGGNITLRTVDAAADVASSLSTAKASMVPSRDWRTSVRTHSPAEVSCHDRRSYAAGGTGM